MNGSKITIALALAALAGAQAQVPDSVAVKVDSLNSGLLRTEAIVGALSKLKVSGFAQFQYVYSTDTNISSSTTGGSSQSYSQKQGAWSLRRARLKAVEQAQQGEEFPIARGHRAGITQHRRQVLEVIILAVAVVEACKDAEDLQVAL